MSKLSFEEALNKLEKVVRQLENGEVTLDESLKLFEEGVKLAKQCGDKLDKAESKIELLLEQNGELIKEPFDLAEQEDE